MVEKNKEYVVQVISQGYEGEGIAKINESYPIFIEGALSGEVVRVKIIKVNNWWIFSNKIIIFLLSKQFQSKRKQDFFDIQNITSWISAS